MITIHLAGLDIGLDHRYPFVERFTRAYRTDNPPMFTVSATEEELDREGELGEQPYPRGYLESIVLYRKIAERLPEYDGFVFHGVALACEGAAYLFTAKSGVGKTTHARLWLDAFSDVHILNGDKPIIRRINGISYVFGSPWQGKENYGCNESLPLGGVAFVKRAEKNSARPVGSSEAVLPFLSQTYVPQTEDGAVRALTLIDSVLSDVSLFVLHVNMEGEAAKVARDALINNIFQETSNEID